MAMQILKTFTMMALAFGLTACSSSKFKTYNGPEVTRVIVNKGNRAMFLMHGDEVLKHYEVDLGFTPQGHKEAEGDGRTPEGEYLIDRRNPNSSFHLSIGIDYPNMQDVAKAKAVGLDPGGEIFIHGGPTRAYGPDWTAGCISVTNDEMEDVYAMVNDGTPVFITP